MLELQLMSMPMTLESSSLPLYEESMFHSSLTYEHMASWELEERCDNTRF